MRQSYPGLTENMNLDLQSPENEGKTHWEFSTWKELWDGEMGGVWPVELNEKRQRFMLRRKELDQCGQELLCLIVHPASFQECFSELARKCLLKSF